MGLLLITHDLGVVAEVADRVVVMDEGRVVEEGPARDLIANPRHARTRQFLGQLGDRTVAEPRKRRGLGELDELYLESMVAS